jgi:uncharacterized protein (DUF1810 family)
MPQCYDLERFVEAQEPIYGQVLRELARGRKESHWMWFIFPQVSGLGFSPMARRFAIGSRREAEAYLAHPVLGPRLSECTGLVLSVQGRTIHEILGAPDDLKFRSCMTLFDAVSGGPIFGEALMKYFPEGGDPATLDILARFDRDARV